MKKYIMKRWIYLILGFSMLSVSCDAWLEVKMEDKILENALFENLEGYNTALNGVYAELNAQSVYGRNLSMGAIDVMAQYYDVLTPETHGMSVYANYDFNQASYKSLFTSVWSSMYSLLANVNLLLENCEKADAPLPGVMKGIVTGEAYALRGMLHFDLLRLYGPCYNNETKSTKVMPFMDKADRVIRPMLSAEEVVNLVLADLNKAIELLKDTDPVIEEGPKNGSSVTDVDNSLNYRQYRLNYYAVRALLARVYMWIGNKEQAVANAKEVVAVAEGEGAWFPFVSRAAVLRDENPNTVFSTEVLFGLYNSSRSQLYDAMFQKDASVVNRLTLFGDYNTGRLRTMFDNENDVRFALWENGMADTVEVLYCNKFAENNDPQHQYMIPLIRTSEMYLLLAECSTSDEEATEYINKIRFARGALNVTVTADTKDKLIADEFAREMIGEGQLFLFYKRKAMESIPDCQSIDKFKEMPLSRYTWELPESEIVNRPQF